jgi:hypothetical protein
MNYIKSVMHFIVGLILISASCRKDKLAPTSELDKLSPATQTGANRIGCLIDGIILNSSDGLFSTKVNSSYNRTFHPQNSAYFLRVSGFRQTADFVYATITLLTDSLAITQGQTLLLTTNIPGMASASYEVNNYGNGTDNLYNSISSKPGQLNITHFDATTKIISGTFSFDAVNRNLDTVHVTNGRFDVTTR